MGRELRRVALDFDWPLCKPWEGFLNPHYRKCPKCDGSSCTTASLRLGDLVSLILLSGSDSLEGKNNPYFHGGPFNHNVIPSPDMAELTAGLAGRGPRGPFGHDAVDSWKTKEKIVQAAGLDPKTWGICPHCKGDGVDPEIREAYEAWEPEDPPAGDGWQLWETVSEGSPVSPVFPTAEKLAEWLTENNVLCGPNMDFVKWMKFLSGPGWAPSFIMDRRGFRDGVNAVADQMETEEEESHGN